MPHLFTSLIDLDTATEPPIDDLIYSALFSEDKEVKSKTRQMIFSLAEKKGAKATSIFPLYHASGHGEVTGFVVPAINIRSLTYDTARLIFRLMQEQNIGALIFEIARSEMSYSEQSPEEFSVSILAAAIKENYTGPVFIQGDHFQFNQEEFKKDREQEILRLKTLIREALANKFYNIDIDASTLVDLTKSDLKDQQRINSEMTALLTEFIRANQPEGITVSIGGEIGHIGDKNSRPEEFEAFMQQYLEQITGTGISKVSVQTGSSHGGTPLPDGTLEKVAIDFNVLKTIGDVAKNKYQLAGAVQHAASTLPLSDFDHFLSNNTIEVHLATGLQNILFDNLPESLHTEMNNWVSGHLSSERKSDQTDEQFLYKNRKKTLGPFKKSLWDLPDTDKQKILNQLEAYLLPIFTKLQIINTKSKTTPYFS